MLVAYAMIGVLFFFLAAELGAKHKTTAPPQVSSIAC